MVTLSTEVSNRTSNSNSNYDKHDTKDKNNKLQ